MTKSEITRRAIIRVAKKHFLANGFKDTYMIDIAKEVKKDRRTIYRHFESKEVLILVILNGLFEKFIQEITRFDYSECLNAFEKVQVLFKGYSDYFISNPDILVITGMLDRNLSNEVRETELYKVFIENATTPDENLYGLLAEGIKDNSISLDGDAMLTAITINNALLSLANRVVSNQEHLDSEQGLDSWKMVIEQGNLFMKAIKNDI